MVQKLFSVKVQCPEILHGTHIYIHIYVWRGGFQVFSLIPGVFPLGNFLWFNLESNKGVVVTKVVISDLGHLTRCL